MLRKPQCRQRIIMEAKKRRGPLGKRSFKFPLALAIGWKLKIGPGFSPIFGSAKAVWIFLSFYLPIRQLKQTAI